MYNGALLMARNACAKCIKINNEPRNWEKKTKQTNQTFLSILPKYFILYVFICRTGTHCKNTKISLKIAIQTLL